MSKPADFVNDEGLKDLIGLCKLDGFTELYDSL